MHVSGNGFTGNHKAKKFGTDIVGLPNITATRQYLVPVIEQTDGQLDLDQDIIYLKEYREAGGDKALVHCNAWEAFSL